MRPIQLSAECRLVFLAAGGPANDHAIAAIAAAPVDWARVVFIAEREEAVAGIWRAIERTSPPGVPPDVTDYLRRRSMVSDFRMLYLSQRLQALLSAFRLADVEVLLLKGAALGASVYESFAARPMADVDLCIRGEHVPVARRVLAACGWTENVDPRLAAFYENHHHIAPFADKQGTGLRVEIHTSAYPREHPFSIDDNEMWNGGAAVGAEYHQARVPSRAHMLLHASVHFAWSHAMRFGGWRTLRDVGALTQEPSMDWEQFARLAKTSSAASVCYWTLRLARQLAGIALPLDVVERLAPPTPEVVRRALERHFVSSLAPGESPPCPSTWLQHQLWRAAIRPRWSGHAASKHVLRDELWPKQNTETATGRALRHLSATRHWWDYAMRTLGTARSR